MAAERGRRQLSPCARSPPLLRSARSVPASSRRKSKELPGRSQITSGNELSRRSKLLPYRFPTTGAVSSSAEASSSCTSPASSTPPMGEEGQAVRAGGRRPSLPSSLEPFCEDVAVPAWASDYFSSSRSHTPWACGAGSVPMSWCAAARGAPAVQTPLSSSASTRAPSPPGTPSTSGGAAHRLLLAERAQLDKDLRIEALESRVRELESSFGGSRSGHSSSCGSLTTNSSRLRDAVRLSVSSDASCVSEGSLDADVDAAVQKSEELLKRMSALNALDEPEMQWASMMAAHEDTQDKLSQIEMLVQRRIDSLKPGDAELRLCRAVRELCTGSQRALPRRGSSRKGSKGGSKSELLL